jgi:hypothetical protein
MEGMAMTEDIPSTTPLRDPVHSQKLLWTERFQARDYGSRRGRGGSRDQADIAPSRPLLAPR